MIRVQCAHCGEMIILEVETDIDAGATFECASCTGETVVDLFRPEERARIVAEERARIVELQQALAAARKRIARLESELAHNWRVDAAVNALVNKVAP